MTGRDLVKTIVIFALTILTSVGSAIALNLVTGPKIAADKAYREELAAQQAAGELLAALPGATGFEEITTTLTLDEGGLVVAVYKEVSGKGYVFIAQDTFGMMVDKVKVTIGVGTDGKIAGSIVSFNNEADFGAADGKVNNTLASINGLDSTLGGYVMSTGATHSSTAIKNAISAGYLVLSSNGLMKAASKTEEQVFESELSKVVSGFVKGADLTPSGNIYQAYKSLNSSVLVCYVEKNESKLMAITNKFDVVTIYECELIDEDTQTYELKDVTADNADVVETVSEYAAQHLTSSYNDLVNMVNVFTEFAGATDFEEVIVENHSTVVAALSFKHNDTVYYTYHAQTYSFQNDIMNVYLVVAADGKIVKMDYTQFFFHEEFFFDQPSLDEPAYKDGFKDLTVDTFDGSQAMVSGATVSSNAVKQAINDIFAAHNKGGNN